MKVERSVGGLTKGKHTKNWRVHTFIGTFMFVWPAEQNNEVMSTVFFSFKFGREI